MNVERQLIGSLLINQERYKDVSYINSEMFSESVLGAIFSVFEHADDEEVNPHYIVARIGSESFLGHSLEELLQELVIEHDAAISDKYCADLIYDSYRVRTINQFLDHNVITPENVEKISTELKDVLSNLEKPDNKSNISTLSDLTKLQGNYFNPKNEKRLKTGFKDIDKAISGFDNGDVTIIAARPGVGKSAFTLQMIRKFGKDGVKTGYFNLEMSEKQIYERAIASASGIDLNRIRLGTNFLNNEKTLFGEGNMQLEKETNVYIISGIQTVNSIRKIQEQYEFDVVVIDYLQLIKSEGKRNGNRIAEVGDISRGIKAIATEFKIPVIALSQLNRASEQFKDKEPSMSELRESGDLEQDASTILMLWNPNRDDFSEKMIKVEKSRNGSLDRVKLYFDGKHMTFSVNDYESAVSRNDDTDSDEIPFD